MQKFNYVITAPQGIHTRPAGLLVKEAQKYENCSIIILKDGKQADAKKLLQVMSMEIRCGNIIEVMIEGEEQTQVATALEKFLKNNL